MKCLQTTWLVSVMIAALMFLSTCSPKKDLYNSLTDAEQKDGWVLLFDGETINGWHEFNKGKVASAWSVVNGELWNNPRAKNIIHADLVTDSTYKNFDLRFEWKISKAGNSGTFINVQENPRYGSTFSTGPEYQLLDNYNVDTAYSADAKKVAGAIFGVVAAQSSKPKPFGQWNESRIVQEDGKDTFWLNGEITATADLNSEEWKNKVAASKLGHFQDFGKAISGKIAFQDYTDEIFFRGIRIKTILDTSIVLHATDDMLFDKTLLTVKAGEIIKLTLQNTGIPSGPGSMGHNVVILSPGTDIPSFAGAGRAAKENDYIATAYASSVIAHTQFVTGGKSDQVKFTLAKPGVYDFICSYPGHWGTMQGKIVAE